MDSKKYVRAVLERVSLPQSVRKRIRTDLENDILAALENGETMEEIIQRMGTPEELAFELVQNYSPEQRDAFREYKSKLTLFGLPLVHIVLASTYLPLIRGISFRFVSIGSRMVPKYGIASVPTAKGVIAIGLKARGILSIGLYSLGLVSIGCFSFGLLSVGAIAFGVLAVGAVSLGLFSLGASAIGFASLGAAAIGYYAIGYDSAGSHIIKTADNSWLEILAKVEGFLESESVASWAKSFYRSAFTLLDWIVNNPILFSIFLLITVFLLIGYVFTILKIKENYN